MLKKQAPDEFDKNIYNKNQAIEHHGFTSRAEWYKTFIQASDDDNIVWNSGSEVKENKTEKDDDEMTDRSAFYAVYDIYKDRIKRRGDKIYAWDEYSGLWTDKPIGIFSTWCGKIHPKNRYGSTSRCIRSCFTFAQELPDEENFFKQAEKRALGKLLFRNAIWDIEKQEQLNFSPFFFFTSRIDRDIPVVRDEIAIRRLVKTVFEDPHPNENIRKELLKSLAVASTGRNPDRRMWVHLGGTATGKSTLIDLFQCAYEGYFFILKAENLIAPRFVGNNDHCGWMIELSRVRFAMTSECPRKRQTQRKPPQGNFRRRHYSGEKCR
jgi:hypothetical protein